MDHLRNRSWFCLAFIAAVLFLAVSIGGEFAHERIHHHADEQEQSSCSFYQLSAQAMFFVVVAVFAVPVFRSYFVRVTREVYLSNFWLAFTSPRAPPVVHP